jgi:DNA-binding MarR family transcriptional regulator
MDYLGLLRNSHIFAAAVREVLEQKFLEETAPSPLSLSQFHLLKLLSIRGSHQVREVADFLGMSTAAASKNITKLEGLGLLERNRSEGDRRATELSITPKGRRTVLSYEELKAARLYPLLTEFSESELEEFTRLLERFSVRLYELEQANGSEPENGFCLRCAAYLDSSCPVGELRGGCPYQKSMDVAPAIEVPESRTHGADHIADTVT